MLLLDTGDGLDRSQEVHLLRGVLDVRVDEERVCLAVDVFNGDLDAVEASGFLLIEEDIAVQRTVNGLGESFFGLLGVYPGESLERKLWSFN